jgi:hypothetical protein
LKTIDKSNYLLFVATNSFIEEKPSKGWDRPQIQLDTSDVAGTEIILKGLSCTVNIVVCIVFVTARWDARVYKSGEVKDAALPYM